MTSHTKKSTKSWVQAVVPGVAFLWRNWTAFVNMPQCLFWIAPLSYFSVSHNAFMVLSFWHELSILRCDSFCLALIFAGEDVWRHSTGCYLNFGVMCDTQVLSPVFFKSLVFLVFSKGFWDHREHRLENSSLQPQLFSTLTLKLSSESCVIVNLLFPWISTSTAESKLSNTAYARFVVSIFTPVLKLSDPFLHHFLTHCIWSESLTNFSIDINSWQVSCYLKIGDSMILNIVKTYSDA